VLLTSSATQDK